MVIIAETLYPPQSGKEVGKRWMEAPSLPDYMKLKGAYIGSVTGGV